MWIKNERRKRPLVKGKAIQGRELLKRGIILDKRWIRVQDGLTLLIMTIVVHVVRTQQLFCYDCGHNPALSVVMSQAISVILFFSEFVVA